MLAAKICGCQPWLESSGYRRPQMDTLGRANRLAAIQICYALQKEMQCQRAPGAMYSLVKITTNLNASELDARQGKVRLVVQVPGFLHCSTLVGFEIAIRDLTTERNKALWLDDIGIVAGVASHTQVC